MKKQEELFLEDNFEKIKLLHKNEKNEIWLVSGKDGVLYVLKYIAYTGLPYKTLKKINHELLPQIIYVFDDGKQTIVIEEYLNGRNMQDFIAEQNFLEEEAAKKILLQFCKGLALLHQSRIIHRDIKPSNLILINDKRVKLIDFDAARLEKENKENDTRYLGTKGYAPPEQYGFGQTDCRSDIYALGVTMKELLGDSYKGSLLRILDKCTQLNPKDRYQSMEKLEHAIKNTVMIKKNRFLTGIVVIGIVIIGIIYTYEKHEYSRVQTKIQQSVENDKTEIIEEPKKEESKKREEEKKIEEPEKQLKQGTVSAATEKPIEKKSSSDRIKILARCAGIEVNGFYENLVVNFSSWENWRRGSTHKGNYKSYSVYFPIGTSAEVTIDNDTGQDIINPVLEFVTFGLAMDEVRDDGLAERKGSTFIYKKATVLKAGEREVYSLPLENARITDVQSTSPRLIIVFKADNYPREHLPITLNLERNIPE